MYRVGNQKGFTILEIIICLFIFSIIALVVSLFLSSSISFTNTELNQKNIRSVHREMSQVIRSDIQNASTIDFIHHHNNRQELIVLTAQNETIVYRYENERFFRNENEQFRGRPLPNFHGIQFDPNLRIVEFAININRDERPPLPFHIKVAVNNLDE